MLLAGGGLPFQDYYRTTLLAEETDPNKLHDLKAALDAEIGRAHV